jgi:hypothetical protein
MFHNFPLWATILIVTLALLAIFIIPLYDCVKQYFSPIKIVYRQFIRFDGLVATDLAITNKRAKEIIVQEIGYEKGGKKIAQETNLDLRIAPWNTVYITYISGERNWYAK